VVKRGASWGIMQVRVDGGPSIAVSEALVTEEVRQGPKELEHILGVTSCFFFECSIILYYKVP